MMLYYTLLVSIIQLIRTDRYGYVVSYLNFIITSNICASFVLLTEEIALKLCNDSTEESITDTGIENKGYKYDDEGQHN